MTRLRSKLVGLWVLLVGPTIVVGCPASLDGRCDEGACEPGGTSSEGGTDGDAGDGAPTDPCVNNPTDPKCLTEETALFVSGAKGDDAAGQGTREKPFRSLTTALGKLSTTKRRIYICEGTYLEDVRLGATHAGVSLFGGLNCDWQASANKPKFGSSPLALRVDDAMGVAIADLAFTAKDATTPGGSSIASFVRGGEVTFKRVALAAGVGVAGENGKPEAYTFTANLNGFSGDPPNNGKENSVTCPGGLVTKGGAGGASGVDGQPGTPTPPDNKGTVAMCTAATGGGTGAPGNTPLAGVGATTHGDLGADGWLSASGLAGEKGSPGQGGGGAGGLGGGTGGGGGAGGCGGAGGGGGTGGGASIALAAFQTTVRITESTLNASQAGKGGDGAAGQTGQSPGGPGGNGTNLTTACKGGTGGNGGSGAAGGGGAGGVSIGVLYKGKPPALDTATTGATAPGIKGAPGGGPGGPTSVGIDGLAAPTLEIK